MSLSLGVLHTRLIPISFGYPYVSRQLVALACPQRRGQPTLLSLADVVRPNQRLAVDTFLGLKKSKLFFRTRVALHFQ